MRLWSFEVFVQRYFAAFQHRDIHPHAIDSLTNRAGSGAPVRHPSPTEGCRLAKFTLRHWCFAALCRLPRDLLDQLCRTGLHNLLIPLEWDWCPSFNVHPKLTFSTHQNGRGNSSRHRVSAFWLSVAGGRCLVA